MDYCENCGNVVTGDFARVFGTNSNQVFACPACVSMRDIMDGAAAAQRPRSDSPSTILP